jgi:quercetin dioxygenase-like cupin family protein
MQREAASVRADGVVRNIADDEGVTTSWGHLSWLVGEEEMPGAEQTFGVVTIQPDQRNPLHLHPNCEELLYVVSGECDHKLGDEMYHLTPGSVIRIPRQVPHWAKCTSREPLVAVISFSAPDRQAVSLEGDDTV